MPRGGYDKFTMAGDIATLLTDHLRVRSPVKLIGHDLGMLVAHALAYRFPELVDQLVLMEAPIPGTRTWNEVIPTLRLRDAKLWHFYFHNGWNDIADLLTFGRERQYLEGFYTYLAHNHEAIGPADIDRYVTSYCSPGAMRAGIDLFRAFDQDADDTRAALKKNGRLKMPVLGVGGAASFFVGVAKEMLEEIAEDVRVVSIPECGHWIAEEQPDLFISEISRFVRPVARKGR